MVGGMPSKSKKRREMLTNDELFYDPDMDDEDEKWVTKQRQQHMNKGMYIMWISFLHAWIRGVDVISPCYEFRKIDEWVFSVDVHSKRQQG